MNIRPHRPFSGIVFQLAGAAIAWKCRVQPTVSLGTTEAEFLAASDAGKMTLYYLPSILNERHIRQALPLTSKKTTVALSSWEMLRNLPSSPACSNHAKLQPSPESSDCSALPVPCIYAAAAPRTHPIPPEPPPFLTYIHSQNAALTTGIATKVARWVAFHDVDSDPRPLNGDISGVVPANLRMIVMSVTVVPRLIE